MIQYTATVALKCSSELGEGALWHAGRGVLYWVDILRHRVNVFEPRTGRNDVYEVGEDVGTVVGQRSGGVMLALKSGFAHLDLQTREVKRVAPTEADNPLVRFNDGKCDPAGRFWAGTMGYKSRGLGKLYRLDADGSVHLMLEPVSTSNGIVWTRDARVMYYIDTPTGRVDAFDYDVHSGSICNRRTAIEVPKEMGHPDGMTIDADDNLWVAMWEGYGVRQFDPRTGALLATVSVSGAGRTTSCALGGENLDELYITTASTGYDDDRRRREPLAGSLFVAKVNARGVPSAEYAG